MRTIGLVGGLSWHSTVSYYRVINERVQRQCGGHSSARIVLQSLDFAEVRDQQVRGDWAGAGQLLSEAARRCEQGGADAVLICSNLMHKVAPAVEAAIDVPLLHIADAVAGEAGRHGWDRLGLLGARWVMEEDFYATRLARHAITAVSPGPDDRDLVDRVVFDELTRGIVRDESRSAYAKVVGRLAADGAQAVVMACTEIQLLLGEKDSPLPLIDSMRLHAMAAADFALGADRALSADRALEADLVLPG